ncbi:MAG: hypothetical protein ACYTGV_16050 [Planctomycetota bacterium]|jgi:hypothetical protein
MAEIHTTTLLTLPDGSRVELRVVPADHQDAAPNDQLEAYLSELEEVLANVENAVEEASSNLDDVGVDADHLAEAAADAVSNAAYNQGVDKDDVESDLNSAESHLLTAKKTVAKIQKMLRGESEPEA